MQVAHTKRVRLLREVTGLEQALVQEIVATVEGAYLTDICNRTTNSINNTVAYALTRLQDNYGQLMPQELLEHKDIVKKTTYHPWDPTTAVFYVVEELLKFTNITGTSYTQIQDVNIANVIIHRTGKFELAIHKWIRMTTFQKTWVRFKQFLYGASITIRDIQPHYLRRRHAPRKNGVRCGRRTAGSPAAGANINREPTNSPGTSGSCGQWGAKHPEIVGHVITPDSGNDAGNTDSIWCNTISCSSRIWSQWIPRWAHKLSWPRKMRSATQRKLVRWPKWLRQQRSNTLLLYSQNVCSYDKILQDIRRGPQ